MLATVVRFLAARNRRFEYLGVALSAYRLVRKITDRRSTTVFSMELRAGDRIQIRALPPEG